MEPIMDELHKELDGKVKFEKVNVDAEPERSNAAGVMSIPTLHVVKDGKIVQTMIGFQSKQDLEKALLAALGQTTKPSRPMAAAV
jgi:thioredoxin 1